MFQLHDRTRRKIALALFFLLCVAPTLAVLGWCLSRRMPGHVRQVARQLGWQLGMTVSLDSVRYPRPGVARYEGLTLSNPETGGRVLFCQEVEARWTTEKSRHLLVLTALGPPEVEAAELEEVGRLVERLLSGRTGWTELNVYLKAAETAILAESGRHKLAAVEGRLQTVRAADAPGRTETSVAGTVAEFAIWPSGKTAGSEARISVRRVRPIGPSPEEPQPVTELVLDTGGAALPCPVLAAIAPIAGRLGPAARFEGTIHATNGRGRWSSRIRGTLSGVDLGRLVADRFPPHRLSGTAEVITLTEVEISAGRVEKLRATIDARDGTISRSLVEAAVRHLRLTSGLVPSDPAELPYRRLAAMLVLDAGGLWLKGLPDTKGEILTDPTGPILKAERSEPVSAVAIAEILSMIRR